MPRIAIDYSNVIFYQIACKGLTVEERYILDILLILRTGRTNARDHVMIQNTRITLHIYIHILGKTEDGITGKWL